MSDARWRAIDVLAGVGHHEPERGGIRVTRPAMTREDAAAVVDAIRALIREEIADAREATARAT